MHIPLRQWGWGSKRENGVTAGSVYEGVGREGDGKGIGSICAKKMERR